MAPASTASWKIGDARRDHQKLLKVNRALGVRPSGEHVDDRNRETKRPVTPQVAIEWDLQAGGSGISGGQGYRQDRIGPEVALVGGAIQIQRASRRLPSAVSPSDPSSPGRSPGARCSTALRTPLPPKRWGSPSSSWIASVRPGADSGRNGSSPITAIGQNHLRFNGWVATKIQHFPGPDLFNGIRIRHFFSPYEMGTRLSIDCFIKNYSASILVHLN